MEERKAGMTSSNKIEDTGEGDDERHKKAIAQFFNRNVAVSPGGSDSPNELAVKNC
jgi:hypothetical protein